MSRNGQTCVGLAFGLMLGIVALNRLRLRKTWQRILALLLVTVFIAFASYQLFEPIRYGIWQISQTAQTAESVVPDEKGSPSVSEAGTENQEPGSTYQADNRSYLKSGRKQIFWSALKSLQLEPKRLLIGSGYNHVMDISHQVIREQAKHFHNTFLQVINEFGIPGLFLVLLFFWRMLLHVFRLTIVPSETVSIGDQMLVLVPLMLMFYFMLEVGIFKIVDMANIRNTVFYFACGMLTAVSYDRMGCC